MARKQQPNDLRRQVKRLVTEKKIEEAYNLLVEEGWVPAGSGYQDHYPNDLALYVQVGPGKQILVSKGRRYWAWKYASNKYTFLYPVSGQYPFDEVCTNIVKELEKRNWDVPGIEVDFHTYGTGAQKYRMVNYIEGTDFKMWFCRGQGHLSESRYNNIAGINEIVIPGKELHVYSDESGPTLYIYVGENWEKGRDKFKHGSKVNSKLNKEPRTYLEYKGNWKKPEEPGIGYTRTSSRAPYLVHTNDLGREYELKKGDKPYYVTSEVMEEFRVWLKENVLKHILEIPVSKKKVGVFAEPEPPDLPSDLGELFCFGERRDVERINKGKKNPVDLEPNDRYGMIGSGYRLVSLGVHNDGTLPEIAYEGFLWCGIGEVSPKTPVGELQIPGHYRWADKERFVLRIIPKNAKGIYIADISGQEEFKKKVWEKNPEQGRLTDDQFQEYRRIIGRTIVPITEYDGNFKEPVVLICRELLLDEVEVVSGPHEYR